MRFFSLSVRVGGGGGSPSPSYPVNTAAPAISGEPTPGSELTVSQGTWSVSGATTYTYSWFLNNVAVGAYTNTYTIPENAQAGDFIHCAVTANTSGATSSANSNGVIVAGEAPVNTVAPAISGTLTAGSLLTVSTGTWSGSPTFSYQWKLDGANVGANQNTYTPPSAGSVYCVVTGTNTSGSASANSNTVTVSAVGGGGEVTLLASSDLSNPAEYTFSRAVAAGYTTAGDATPNTQTAAPNVLRLNHWTGDRYAMRLENDPVTPVAEAPAASPVPEILHLKCNDGPDNGGTLTATVGPDGSTGAAWVVGKSGSGFALDFDGTVAAAVPWPLAPLPYGGAAEITVAFWLNPDVTSNFDIVMESSGNFQSVAGAWGIWLNVGTLSVGFTDATVATKYASCPAPTIGEWTHVAVVFNFQTGAVQIYLNGVASGTPDGAWAGATTALEAALSIGSRGAGTAGQAFGTDGRFDDIRIYTGDKSADLAAIIADAQ